MSFILQSFEVVMSVIWLVECFGLFFKRLIIFFVFIYNYHQFRVTFLSLD